MNYQYPFSPTKFALVIQTVGLDYKLSHSLFSIFVICKEDVISYTVSYRKISKRI